MRDVNYVGNELYNAERKLRCEYVKKEDRNRK